MPGKKAKKYAQNHVKKSMKFLGKKWANNFKVEAANMQKQLLWWRMPKQPPTSTKLLQKRGYLKYNTYFQPVGQLAIIFLCWLFTWLGSRIPGRKVAKLKFQQIFGIL